MSESSDDEHIVLPRERRGCSELDAARPHARCAPAEPGRPRAEAGRGEGSSGQDRPPHRPPPYRVEQLDWGSAPEGDDAAQAVHQQPQQQHGWGPPDPPPAHPAPDSPLRGLESPGGGTPTAPAPAGGGGGGGGDALPAPAADRGAGHHGAGGEAAARSALRRLLAMQKELMQAAGETPDAVGVSTATGRADETYLTNLRKELCQGYAGLMTDHPEFAVTRDIAVKLWRSCFYRRMEHLRRAVRKVGPDGAQAVRAEFFAFVDEASAFFEGLSTRLLGPGSQRSSALRRLGSAALVYLGDLARYREQQAPVDGRTWRVARGYYERAIDAYPAIGVPHNQLALLAQYDSAVLEAAYRFLRAQSCGEPFAAARENLISHFESNRVACGPPPHSRRCAPHHRCWHCDSACDSNDPEVLQGVRRSFERRFVRAHGILFTHIGAEAFDPLADAACGSLAALLRGGAVDSTLMLRVVATNTCAVRRALSDAPLLGPALELLVGCFAHAQAACAANTALDQALQGALVAQLRCLAAFGLGTLDGQCAGQVAKHAAQLLNRVALAAGTAQPRSSVQLPEDDDLLGFSELPQGEAATDSATGPEDEAAARLLAADDFINQALGLGLLVRGRDGRLRSPQAPEPQQRAPDPEEADRERGPRGHYQDDGDSESEGDEDDDFFDVPATDPPQDGPPRRGAPDQHGAQSRGKGKGGDWGGKGKGGDHGGKGKGAEPGKKKQWVPPPARDGAARLRQRWLDSDEEEGDERRAPRHHQPPPPPPPPPPPQQQQQQQQGPRGPQPPYLQQWQPGGPKGAKGGRRNRRQKREQRQQKRGGRQEHRGYDGTGEGEPPWQHRELPPWQRRDEAPWPGREDRRDDDGWGGSRYAEGPPPRTAEPPPLGADANPPPREVDGSAWGWEGGGQPVGSYGGGGAPGEESAWGGERRTEHKAPREPDAGPGWPRPAPPVPGQQWGQAPTGEGGGGGWGQERGGGDAGVWPRRPARDDPGDRTIDVQWGGDPRAPPPVGLPPQQGNGGGRQAAAPGPDHHLGRGPEQRWQPRADRWSGDDRDDLVMRPAQGKYGASPPRDWQRPPPPQQQQQQQQQPVGHGIGTWRPRSPPQQPPRSDWRTPVQAPPPAPDPSGPSIWGGDTWASSWGS